MGSEVEVGGFDDIAKRAVEAANAGGLEGEAEEIASKSERIMRPSMAVRHPLRWPSCYQQPSVSASSLCCDSVSQTIHYRILHFITLRLTLHCILQTSYTSRYSAVSSITP